MNKKIRILFSIEAADQWILEAYRGFFDSLELGSHEIFCTVYGVRDQADLLRKYNVIDYEKISYAGLNLLNHGLSSMTSEELIRRAQESSLWNSPEQILKRLSLFKVVLSLLQPDVVIVWNGMGDIRRMVRIALSKLHIPFFYAEKGMLPNSWYIDEEGINPRCSLDGSSFERTIHPAERIKIEDYIKDIVKSGSSAWQQPSRIAGKQTLKERLQINSRSNVIFFPGQVDDDVNITAFSHFQNVAEAVRLVLESMPKDATLVVKPHPKSKEKSRELLKKLSEQHRNLITVKDVNIWDLIDISDLVVSINSTVAFESLLRKKKVLLLGDSVLSKTGLLNKAKQADLKRQIREYLSTPFESLIDYSRVISFVKFLKENYYLFRDSPQLPVGIEERLVRRAKAASPKIFTQEVLMSAFYKDIPQQHLLGSPTRTAKATTAPTPCAPKLSVVLTAHNRPELLETTLAGFANQTIPKGAFEVIVVDDGSEPPVKEVAEKFRGNINIVYIFQENSGLAAARNNGINAAKGQIVLFSDDDDVPGPELVAEHLHSHRENPDERIAVLGHLDWHGDLEVTPLMHYITHEGGQYFGYDRMQDGQLYDVWKWWGGLISAKMSLLKSVEGPFDSQLRFGYEDTELACRLLPTNIKVLYNAKARSYILRAVDFESFCQRRYMQGRALHYVASAHPDIIIPRYRLQDAASRYHSEYAPFLEEWSSKVIKFESLLNSQIQSGRRDIAGHLKSLFTVYHECFVGYWLKGYVEQMKAVEGRKVSLSKPVDRRHTESRDKAELDCNRPSMPSVTEPLRITFINSNTPGFDVGSSNLRIFHILKILVAAGHKIDHLYFNRYEDDERYKAAFDGAVNFIKVLGTVNSFSNYLHFNKVEKLDCVWITNLWSVDYLNLAIQLTQWLKRNRPQTKVIIDTMDFHYKKFIRKFNISHEHENLLEARYFLEAEKRLYPLADEVLTVTEVEKRDMIDNIGSNCNVGVIPNIHTISAQGPDLQQRRHICFLGSFRINHNADAVRWFLKEVFPLIVEKAPEVEFHILGFNNEQFRAELEVEPNVKVIGYVQDAESAVAGYRLFVCPMIYGAGMKGKLGLTAGVGTPIVTTTIGAEGFDFVDGQHCFIADTGEEFARKCLHLLSEDSLWNQFSRKAKEMVAEKFSIRAVSEKIHALLQSVTTARSAHQVTDDPVEVPASSDHFAPPQAPVRPKVSIITSCYNSARFLRQCLDSVRNQTMHQWELFLLDDGSADDTRSIIEEHSRMDERIKPYYFHDNEGPYVRRNFAIERANSDFIVIQDADDIMSPAKLEILHNEIAKDEQLAVVGSFSRIFLDEFKGLQYTDTYEFWLENNEIADKFASWQYAMSHASAIIRKELFEQIGFYDENPFASDRFWFAKLGEYAKYYTDAKFKNIPEYLTLIRIHPGSQTQLVRIFDPRSRRMRYCRYCEFKLRKIRQKLETFPNTDMKTELRNCVCSDFLERFKDHIIRWENEPLADNVIPELLKNSVRLFNKSFYVSCINMLNGMEVMVPDIVERFRNYDLLRAMAFFAIDMKEQSLTYLNREIQNHNNPAAKQFISDYFEGPRSARRSQTANSKQQFQIDVQKWCAEHSDLYELQMIDTRIVPEAV